MLPLAGSSPDGADTLSVDPSAAAVVEEAVGEVGVDEELLQPATTSRDNSEATKADGDGVGRINLQRGAVHFR
jgi:hypothetical protein